MDLPASKQVMVNNNKLLFSIATVRILRKYSQQILWALALLFLFFMNTENESTSLCMFGFMGFKSCPGCGIGHAIHHTLHLNFIQSFNSHILGIPATIGILYLIIKPFYDSKIISKWTNNKCL